MALSNRIHPHGIELSVEWLREGIERRGGMREGERMRDRKSERLGETAGDRKRQRDSGR